MATAHNQASIEDIAKVVLLPGDPLRAKFIAEHFLENVTQFNDVRNMLGFTGYYKGKRISVMGSGMGMASTGIYSHELFNKYDVDAVIRIGSCGAYSNDLKLYDLVLVESSWSESTYAHTYSGYEGDVVYPSVTLNEKIEEAAKKINIDLVKSRVHSTDCFYRKDKQALHRIRDEHQALAVEMESFALFHNANEANKMAACLLTVSDHALTNEKTTQVERETCFTKMMQVALETAIELA